MNNALIIPTFNESGNILPLYKKLKLIKKYYKIIFVDDSSNDGTIDEIKSLIKKDKNVILKSEKLKMG